MDTDDPVVASSDIRMRQRATGENDAFLNNMADSWKCKMRTTTLKNTTVS